MMGIKKIDKATAIKSILSDLKKGVDKPAILSKYVEKCQKNDRTVRRWYDDAEIEYKKFLDKAAPVIEAKEIEALGEIAKAGIMSKLERMQLLSDLANGKKKAWKEVASMGSVVKLELYDPVKYIAELNKMDGAYLNEDDENEFNGFEIEEI